MADRTVQKPAGDPWFEITQDFFSMGQWNLGTQQLVISTWRDTWNGWEQNIIVFFFDYDSGIIYQHSSFFFGFDFSSALPQMDKISFFLSDISYDHSYSEMWSFSYVYLKLLTFPLP